MTRRSSTDLQALLLQAQMKILALATDKEWDVNNANALVYDLPSLRGTYALVIFNRNGNSMRRLAGYRSADIVYRARHNGALILFCHAPEKLTSPILAAARNDGLDVLTAYGLCDGTLDSIPLCSKGV